MRKRVSGPVVSWSVLGALVCIQLASASVAWAQGGAGALDVDPEAAERALERTLAKRGVLLLPQGAFEIEPSLTYEYTERDGFVLGQLDGDFVLDSQRIERSEFTAALSLRYGLPGDSQIEMTVPAIVVKQDVEEGLFDSGDEGDEQGLGDLSLGVATALLRESGGIPDLVARLTWDTDFGEDTEGPVSISSDFNEVQLGLSALWRVDPVALTAGVAYQKALEKDDFQPGDVFGFSVGASLAASPTVALGVNFNASYRGDSEFDGESIEDSSQNQATVSFSLSNIVGRNKLLSVEFGAGLTEDSPDYFVSASMPIRW